MNTGDIASIDADGNVRIVDRVKHIFKLSQGEYISPEQLEKIYINADSVSQIFIDGRSDASYLVAVVVPSRKDVDVKQIHEDLNTIAHDHKLEGYKRVHKILVAEEPFSLQNGLVTPTEKLCRPKIRAFYRSSINNLYASV